MTIALLLHTLLHWRPPSKYDVMVYQMAFMGGAIDPGMMAGMGRLEREQAVPRRFYLPPRPLRCRTRPTRSRIPARRSSVSPAT